MMRFALVAVSVLAAGDCVAAPPPSRTAPPRTAPIEQRLTTVREIAEKVIIDGRAGDWTGIPTYADPRGDGGNAPGLDIVKTAIAPTDDALLMMVATAVRAVDQDWVYHFHVELPGLKKPYVKVSLRGGDVVSLYAVGSNKTTLNQKIECAIGEVIELRVPWKLLASVLEEDDAKELAAHPRSIIRVTPSSYNTGGDLSRADLGATAVSFRLTNQKFDLDPPLPSPQPGGNAVMDAKPVPIPLPVRGQWFVLQGPFGETSHQGEWSYDLTVIDRYQQANPGNTDDNAGYLSWGQPVFAPLDGRVTHAAGNNLDNSRPGDLPAAKNAPVNSVFIEIAPGLRLGMYHLQRGSVKVAAGTSLKQGTQIGAVGNSGWSATPHLHLALWREQKTVPLLFQRVRVSLNATADDYWARDMETWEPREGFFVENLPRK